MAHMLRAPQGATKKRKIVGRGPGSGHGGTAGRGNNGQNARSGGGVRPGFEGGQMPLFRRVARRGFSNYPFKRVALAVNIARLEELFTDGDVVNLETLAEKGLIGKKDRNVKILGSGSLTKKLTVEIPSLSASAREKIEKAGGSVVVKEAKQQDETHGQ